MALSDMLMRVVGFLRAGYPEGIPAHDYIPLLALLRRRLSDDEVIAVAEEMISGGNIPVDDTDVRVAITKLTDEMPSPEDTERVKRRLAAVGWPVSDAFGSSD
jgi:predicted nucleotidyltransferase